MPAYHSKQVQDNLWESCSCALLPLKTSIRGPAQFAEADTEDIIDETLSYFRANVLFRNFDVRGGPDRTLIYLTLFTAFLLVKAEKFEDKATATREFKQLAIKPFAIPGEAGFPLTGLFPPPADKNEADTFRGYFKQAREELANRLVERIYNSDGTRNKWWQAFSKRKFMGKELKE